MNEPLYQKAGFFISEDFHIKTTPSSHNLLFNRVHSINSLKSLDHSRQSFNASSVTSLETTKDMNYRSNIFTNSFKIANIDQKMLVNRDDREYLYFN